MVNKPGCFGVYLKKKRLERGLRQVELAETINKTGMYISNIENGKNNPPSNKKDLDALAKILDLTKEELITFYEVAAEDRNTLPPEMIKYIHECSDLKNIIRFGLNKKKTNSYWQQIKKRIMEEM